ncbi:hypothetical protein M433DRAFT_378323 [Acidomyces richmondensis BFW]|nr:MAG: hypothetical protein FE78DRAFT_110844 [Acidomyces sp. 'richmondensis']KYG43005.1 hypothetical protein M433DRAFT_378323 [Acidomyces richmondensis BFW]
MQLLLLPLLLLHYVLDRKRRCRSVDANRVPPRMCVDTVARSCGCKTPDSSRGWWRLLSSNERVGDNAMGC